jgi:hypothetical protein
MKRAGGQRRDGNICNRAVSAATLLLGPEDGPGPEALPVGRLTRGTLRPTKPTFN